MQGLIHALSTRGWSRPTVPQAVLVRDFARCRWFPASTRRRRTPPLWVTRAPRYKAPEAWNRTVLTPILVAVRSRGGLLTTRSSILGVACPGVVRPGKVVHVTRVITDRADGRLCTRS